MKHKIDIAKLKNLLETKVQEVSKEIIESLLMEERDEFIERNGGRKNGFYTRDLIIGDMKIKDLRIPRDREGKWRSSLLPKPYQRYVDEGENNFCDLCVKLCFTGYSYREVAIILKEHFNIELSYSTLCRMIKSAKEVVDKFRSSPLEATYVVLYLDAKYAKLFYPNGIDRGLTLVAMGLNKKGEYEVLDIEVVPTDRETAQCYEDLLKRLKQRGLKQIYFLLTDGINGIEKIARKFFNNFEHQRCITHYKRNIVAKVRKKDVQAVLNDFDDILKQSNIEKAKKYFYEEFYPRWIKSYKPLVNQMEKDLDSLLPHLILPEALRKYVKTSNVIERFMRTLNTANKRSAYFGGFERVEHLAVYCAMEYNRNEHKISHHKQWKNFWENFDYNQNFP